MAQLCREVTRDVSFWYRPIVDTIETTTQQRHIHGERTLKTKQVTQEVCVAGGRGPNESLENFLKRMETSLTTAISHWKRIEGQEFKSGALSGDDHYVQVTYPLLGSSVVNDPNVTDRCGALNKLLGTCGATGQSSQEYLDPKTGKVLVDSKNIQTAGYSGGCSPRKMPPMRACFSGTTKVMTKNGGMMSLSSLAYLYNTGAALPEIASYNLETGKIVYQKPARVLTHPAVRSGVVSIGTAERLDPLQVTQDHPMLVRRNGVEFFAPVKELGSGDCLVSPLGGCSQYESGKKFISYTPQNLYDVSMPEIHNFLVCTDATCYVGHNKPM